MIYSTVSAVVPTLPIVHFPAGAKSHRKGHAWHAVGLLTGNLLGLLMDLCNRLLNPVSTGWLRSVDAFILFKTFDAHALLGWETGRFVCIVCGN